MILVPPNTLRDTKGKPSKPHDLSSKHRISAVAPAYLSILFAVLADTHFPSVPFTPPAHTLLPVPAPLGGCTPGPTLPFSSPSQADFTHSPTIPTSSSLEGPPYWEQLGNLRELHSPLAPFPGVPHLS